MNSGPLRREHGLYLVRRFHATHDREHEIQASLVCPWTLRAGNSTIRRTSTQP